MDHVGDLSSLKESIGFLRFLLFSKDSLVDVRVLEDFCHAAAILVSVVSKLG